MTSQAHQRDRWTIQLADKVCPRHFQELQRLQRDSLWSDVPIWLWSPIVTESEVEWIARSTEELCRVLIDIGSRELQEGRASQWLPPAPGLVASVGSDSLQVDPCFHWRFDFLWERAQERLTFLEVNAGDPSGLGWIATFSRAMREHSLWAEFLADESRCFPLFESLERATQKRLGRTGQVCLVAARTSTVSSDIACLGELFRQSGWRVAIADPQEFRFSTEGCFVGGERIDILFRDTYEELFWDPNELVGERIVRAQQEGKLLVLNPLSASFWDCKSLWSRLPDLSTVGLTKILDPSLVKLLEEEQERWVVKPAFDYGGRGVVCGFAAEPNIWKREVFRAAHSATPHVAQSRALGSSMAFPFLRGSDDIVWEQRLLTWSAWIHNGRFTGLYARASLDPVVNVHNGGAILPVYRISEPEPSSASAARRAWARPK